MAGPLYMAVAGYNGLRKSGCPKPGIEGTVGRVKSRLSEAGWEGRTLRVYKGFSGPSLALVWAASWEPEELAELRGDLREDECLEEAFWWPSVYRESPYVKGSTPEEVMEALRGEPLRYFIAYPMKKSPEWYLLPFEERRKIMGEHIRIAREATGKGNVRSYTTYSFGIADYEFLVIYEAEDLDHWERIVERLREAKARKWIVREEPVVVGIRV